MAQYKSDNQYYKSADITRPLKNLEKIMGLSGTADSDYLTGLGKVSRLEGTEMDNRKKQGLWDALQLALQGKSPDEAFARHSGTSAFDLQKLFTGEKEQPFRVDIQRQKARQEQQGVEQGDLLAKLAREIANSGIQPNIEDYETGPGKMFKGGTQYDDAIAGAAKNFEQLARKYSTLTGKPGAFKTEQQQAALVGSDIGVEDTVRAYNRARTRAVENVGEERVKEIEARTNKVISDMNIGLDIGHEKVNNLRQVGLDAALIAQQRGLNLKETNALIKKNVEIAAEKLLGASADTSKKTTQAASELEKYWNLSKELYLKAKKQKAEINKLQTQTQTAESKLRVAELTEAYQVTIAKANAAKAQSQAGTAKSKQKMSAADLAGYKEKLKNLEDQRKVALDKGKVLLQNAETDRERKEIKLRIERELEPINISIKELQEANAKLTGRKISSDIRRNLTNMSSPSDLDLTRLLKKAQIVKAQGDDMGDGAIIPDPDAEVPVPAPAEPASPVTSGGGLSTDNIMPNILKLMKTLGIGGDNGGNQASVSQDPMAAELAKLSQQPVAKWTPIQRKKYINHAVKNLGLDPQAAASLLQRAIQAQGPSIRR